MIGTPDRVFVVLDDQQRIALGREAIERVEQNAIVARMQTDGRLIEDVTHALQIRTELRREPDALRLASGQRRRRAIQREIAETDVFEKRQARVDLGQHVARDVLFAPLQLQPGAQSPHVRDRSRSDRGDRLTAKAHVARDRRSDARRRSSRRAAHLPRTIRSTRSPSPLCSASKPRICRASAEAALAPPVPELNENRRGSSSAKLRAHEGHARRVEKIRASRPLRCRLHDARTTPLP